jgi:6-phosphogluconolactonase
MGVAQLVHFPNDDALADAVAVAWLEQIAQASSAGRKHRVALSGGRVAKKLFAAVANRAGEGAAKLDGVEFFWADERCVPPTDPESNFRLAHELLFLPLGIAGSGLHRIPGELEPASAAAVAAAELRQASGCELPQMPVLDLVLLGMGEDGHVASLFPGDAATERDLDSVFLGIANSPKPPPRRVTLGHGALAAAREVWVLASGTGKQAALRESLAPDGRTPLAQVIQHRSSTKIFTDLTS